MIKPLSNHLLVARVVPEKIGSILMPQSFQDDNNTGGNREVRILAVGPGRRNKKGIVIPLEAEPGDRAIINCSFSGGQPLADGTILITDDVILAVIPNKPINT